MERSSPKTFCHLVMPISFWWDSIKSRTSTNLSCCCCDGSIIVLEMVAISHPSTACHVLHEYMAYCNSPHLVPSRILAHQLY